MYNNYYRKEKRLIILQSEQLLRNLNISPTIEIISEGLGLASNVYMEFIHRLEAYNIKVDWRYYNDGKAWLGKGVYTWTTKRGTQKDTTAFWLSVWDGFFKVTIYIPEKYRTDALALALSDETQEMIENAQQIGKLKFFPLIFDLYSDELFDDIFKLIHFRATL